MKKIGIVMLICLLALFSCNKERTGNDIVPTSINVAELPAAVTTYISDNYPDATIFAAAEMTNNEAKYLVLLSTEEELAFDAKGNFLGDGQSFCHGGRPFPGGDSLHHGHCWPGCPGNWINIDSLAGAIKSYITTNYPDYRIWHAEKDSICPTGALIEVMIRKTGSRPPVNLKLFFDLASNYIMMAQRIRFMDLPQPVRDYISNNFENIHRCTIAEKLTLSDNSINYAVYINQPRLHRRIVLTENGALVCEQ